jgi:hypothetical protein
VEFVNGSGTVSEKPREWRAPRRFQTLMQLTLLFDGKDRRIPLSPVFVVGGILFGIAELTDSRLIPQE